MDQMVGWSMVVAGLAFFAYAYVAYPLVIHVLPRRPPSPLEGDPVSKVSVVIAACRPGRALLVKVAELMRTEDPSTEIVIVLDGPDESVARGLSEIDDPRLRVVSLPESRGKAAALNEGVAASSGEILIFTDVRQRLEPGAIARLVTILRSPDVGAASGCFQFERGVRKSFLDYYWRWEGRLRFREWTWDSSVGVSGGFYALKREFWKPLPVGLLLDDLWLPMLVVQAGYRVAYEPSAKARDVAFGPDNVEFVRKVRTLTGNYQLLAWMPWVLSPFHNRIWFQFISHKVLRLATPLASAAILCGVFLVLGFHALWFAALVVPFAVLWKAPLGPRGRNAASTVVSVVRTAVLIHVALVLASLNALRGRWNVWSDVPRPMIRSAERR